MKWGWSNSTFYSILHTKAVISVIYYNVAFTKQIALYGKTVPSIAIFAHLAIREL
jgi:hypothetical protein